MRPDLEITQRRRATGVLRDLVRRLARVTNNYSEIGKDVDLMRPGIDGKELEQKKGRTTDRITDLIEIARQQWYKEINKIL